MHKCTLMLLSFQVPDAMDCQQGHILLAFAPMRLLQVRATVHGKVRPNYVPAATLTPVRELNLMSPARPLLAAALVINRYLPPGLATLAGTATLQDSMLSEQRSSALPPPPGRRALSPSQSSMLLGGEAAPQGSGGLMGSRALSGGDDAVEGLSGSWEGGGEESWRSVAPMHCLLLRWGGLLTLVHLDTAHETHLLEVTKHCPACQTLLTYPDDSTYVTLTAGRGVCLVVPLAHRRNQQQEKLIKHVVTFTTPQ